MRHNLKRPKPLFRMVFAAFPPQNLIGPAQLNRILKINTFQMWRVGFERNPVHCGQSVVVFCSFKSRFQTAVIL